MIKCIHNRTYGGIITGILIRGQIGKDKIFRVRRGNGYYGAEKGNWYQDQIPYYVPSSINNPQSEPYRVQMRAAVLKWQTGLTDAEKKEYQAKASNGMRMGGYHLFMKLAMKGEVDMYVDRGDPAAVDFVSTDLTIDGAWHVLDLSALIPKAAKAVLLCSSVQSANPGDSIRYRRAGNTNEINACGCEALRANVVRHRLGICAVPGTRQIEYNADNVAWATLSIVVRGWWT